MSAMLAAVTPETIAQCGTLIFPHTRRTPVIEVDGAEFGLPAHRLTLKLELLQHAGSFKTRGAFANLLAREVPLAGVVAASGGNHGAAVAYAAMKLGKPAKIFIPTISSPAKVQRIRDYGADLAIEGARYAEALAASGLDAANRRPAGAGFRSGRNHHGPGNAWPRTRRTGAGYRYGPSVGRRRRPDRRHRRLVCRPHQRHRGRAACLADPDEGTGSRTPCRRRSRRPGRGFAGAAARRRKGISDRPEIRATNRAGVRRGHRRRAGDALARVVHRGRARRCRSVLRDPLGRLQAAGRRTAAIIISGGNTAAVNFPAAS